MANLKSFSLDAPLRNEDEHDDERKKGKSNYSGTDPRAVVL